MEPVCPLFWGVNPPKQGRNSNQNRGHLGSMDMHLIITWVLALGIYIFP